MAMFDAANVANVIERERERDHLDYHVTFTLSSVEMNTSGLHVISISLNKGILLFYNTIPIENK